MSLKSYGLATPNCLAICLLLTASGCSTLYSTDTRIEGFVPVGSVADKTPRYAQERWFYIETGNTNGKTTVEFETYKGSDTLGKSPSDNTPKSVEKGKKYDIDETQLSDGYQVLYREGLNVGSLVVPFKLRFGTGTAKASLSPSSTVGGLIGYRGYISRSTTLSVGAFVGYSPVPLNDVNSTDIKVATGISYGIATTFDFGFISAAVRKFQAGVALGWDFVTGSDGDQWAFNQKPWLSIGIGYNFYK